ncbi:MAG: hypothetical protein LBH81_02235, partial [Rickettsiales bacterium]|nr:hypothetical protein [Rickettsiales bacterium]
MNTCNVIEYPKWHGRWSDCDTSEINSPHAGEPESQSDSDGGSKPTLNPLGAHKLMDASRWVGADGTYSGFRYGVDAGVGVALGAVGAIVTNKMMKSSQKDAGFDK